MEHQFVVFDLSNECYGVQITAVESIIKMQTITRLPHTPSFVEGVTNLRGKVLPVIHLRKRFGLDDTANTRDSRIMVVDVGGTKVGMIVDGVSEVLSIADDAVEPPSPISATIDSGFINGIAKLEKKLVILIDLSKVLSTGEQSELKIL
jgi:purine-binding chemotaxis protein CheW